MKTAVERFWEKVEKTEACWLWTGARGGRMKHGQILFDGRTQYAHRVSYEMHVGPVADGLWVLHHCDVPACVNPDHLYLGTHRDNMADRDARGRTFNGQASKTHCKNGHEFTPANTYLYKDGRGRQCKACWAVRLRARRKRLKEETPAFRQSDL